MPEFILLAVAGNPVLHSRSPEMFDAAFRKLGIRAHYVRLAAWDAQDILKSGREMGLSGINVTSPFKESVAQLVDNMDSHARAIGAVNTISTEGGRFIGHNTDYFGVQASLAHALGELKGKKAIVLGAGGAAKAAAYALVSAGARTLVLNRTAEKASKIAKELGCKGGGLECLKAELSSADILISCLPTSGRVVPMEALRPSLAILDANYGAKTALQEDAEKMKCKIVDGREWLLYQAVPRFEHLTGLEPPIPEMRRALYSKRKPKKPNIALIGFMGAGKSSVGKAIAEKTGMKFIDLDQEIEKAAGAAIPEIFQKRGEAGFRKLEKAAARRLIPKSNGAVFSCGGGIILDAANRRLISENCIAIWLWASPETAAARAEKEGHRPLLGAGPGSVARARELLGQRMAFYAETSDLVINTNEKSPEEIAGRILYEIDTAFGH
jgi:shikimate dehydrogenase